MVARSTRTIMSAEFSIASRKRRISAWPARRFLVVILPALRVAMTSFPEGNLLDPYPRVQPLRRGRLKMVRDRVRVVSKQRALCGARPVKAVALLDQAA